MEVVAPNDLWTADFKGQFRTLDGRYCYPLTIADEHSRYLLACDGLLSTEQVGARGVFERAFAEYGLPSAIRTDNGSPFAAAHALHGLSALSVLASFTWWRGDGALTRIALDRALRVDPPETDVVHLHNVAALQGDVQVVAETGASGADDGFSSDGHLACT